MKTKDPRGTSKSLRKTKSIINEVQLLKQSNPLHL